ncbi:addiction module antidote protein [Chelativorans intermedius]|uniref:Addiction module antidote protein n=1 Tax=Chelativorans intermedius TaxID=515947 RepID=A0ABV6D5W6_9HYPH|nr:addiction module antidote protein [Chelativorans intermedius]MCT8997494.1 putative addiction module antidote protein [Chelativorans intermedius]
MTKEIKTAPWDSAEYLDTPEAIEEYLIATFEDGDAGEITKALGTVARARNISKLAREVGMTRAALYRAFNGETSPSFDTIMKIMRALGVKITPNVSKSEEAA